MAQYTIRNVPEKVDAVLRDHAKRLGLSMNEVAIQALERGLGVGGEAVVHDDLDDLIGSWQHDPDFDAAIADQQQTDEALWQ